MIAVDTNVLLRYIVAGSEGDKVIEDAPGRYVMAR